MKKIFICFMLCMLAGCSADNAEKGAVAFTENPVETIAPAQEADSDKATKSPSASHSTATSVQEKSQFTPHPTALPDESPPDGVLVFDTLSNEEKRKLNVFFSNFAEASFEEYDCDNISAETLIAFAFAHNRINRTSKEEYDMFTSPYFESIMGIRTEVMDKIIGKYFGVSVPHNDTVSKNKFGRYDGWAFKDGYVYTCAADGAFYDYCAVATTLADMGDGTYLAEYDVYSTELDGMDKKYYSYTPEQAQEDSALEFCGAYTAIIKPAVVDGKNTWQLLELNKIF